MKHLLGGVAVAALLSITGPASAQTPMSPSTAAAPPAAAPTASQPPATPPKTTAPRPKRQVQRSTGGPRSYGNPSDHVADQLNAEQLGHAAGPGPQPGPPPHHYGPPPGYPPQYGPPQYGPPQYGPPGYPPPGGYPMPWGYPVPWAPGWGGAPPY